MIDLHVHSTASDGTFSPTEIAVMAKNKQLKAVALTDHDTTAGLEEFTLAGKQNNVETIPGIELSASWYHSSVHILGLFIDPDAKPLKTFLKTIIDQRLRRNEKIIAKINSLGFNTSIEEWQQKAENSVPGRPHLAALLVEQNYFPDIKTVFDELIGNHSPGFEPRVQPQPEEAINIIHKAGGLAIWAHPYAMRSVPYSTLKKTGLTLKGYGLDGLETYYSHFTENEITNSRRFATQYNMLESGGSDFHGENSPNVQLGSGLGTLDTPDLFLEKMKAKLGR